VRCEEKIAGGKLIAIEVWTDKGVVTRAKITGDFFLHPEEAINRVELSLEGMPISAGEAEVAGRLGNALAGSVLIGASAGDFARIFIRAVSG
jgi:lipoate-protein ligase A